VEGACGVWHIVVGVVVIAAIIIVAADALLLVGVRAAIGERAGAAAVRALPAVPVVHGNH
jgi:hypothetical protein